VRTIFGAVKYLHGAGIVHRDLKPQNILFRRPGNHTQVVLADFGLSQILEGHHIHFLKDICGTPGYMAPEIWDRTGYGKAVDIWALGVITYHLLVGYTPFDRASTKVKMENTLSGGFHFEPSEYWVGISDAAKKFIQECLITDSLARPSADQALELEWLTEGSDSSATRSMERAASPPDLLPSIKTATNAREEWRNVALLRFRSHARLTEPATDVGLGQDIETTSQRFRELVEEAEKVWI
jgi:calcium/calmodulin-dependent protein kinase I